MLRVGLRGWLYILLLAITLGFSFAGFVSILLDAPFFNFSLLGVLTAFYIFLFSLATTELNNRWLILRIPQALRTPFSLLLAFLSGYMGSLLGYWTNFHLKLVELELSYWKVHLLALLLSVITSSIGYLLYKLILFQKREEESKRLLLEENLRNLEHQISPHFVFNTLNAIVELIHSEPNKAEEALLRFSSLLRKSLYLEPFVSLQEELELLEDYWKVLSLRFWDRIELEISVEEELLDIKVPKFALQVLVENAVKHGLKFKRGKVRIRARREGDYALVEVSDNGVGFQSLREGIGLKNLRRRLEILQGSLSYRSSEEGTTFSILLPLKA